MTRDDKKDPSDNGSKDQSKPEDTPGSKKDAEKFAPTAPPDEWLDRFPP